MNLNKKMVQDANGRIPEQFYDEELDEFVPVSEKRPKPIRVYPKHNFIDISQGVDSNWYELVSDNEVITFNKPLNTIKISADDTKLKIKFNDDPDPLYIDQGELYTLEDFNIEKITVENLTGTKIRWVGLGI